MAINKILITGATGFLGSNLVPRLLANGYEVHTIERKKAPTTTTKNLFRHFLDVTEYTKVRELVKEIQPEYVINLAALASVPESISRYLETCSITFTSAINLAEICRTEVKDFKQFITAGSQEEYGSILTDKSQKLTEYVSLKPNNPYAIAKVAVEIYLDYLYRAYSFPYTVIRTFITYGRKEDAPFFIDNTITKMSKNEPVSIMNPNSVRDWIYIDDQVEGYMKALGNKNAIGQAFNLCCGEGHTAKEAADMIARLSKSKSKIIFGEGKRHPLDIQILIGDNSKAKKLLAWAPQYNLEKGLEKTIKCRTGLVSN
jgi:nucleoside-diphosphate-sugar epimerase